MRNMRAELYGEEGCADESFPHSPTWISPAAGGAFITVPTSPTELMAVSVGVQREGQPRMRLG